MWSYDMKINKIVSLVCDIGPTAAILEAIDQKKLLLTVFLFR